MKRSSSFFAFSFAVTLAACGTPPSPVIPQPVAAKASAEPGPPPPPPRPDTPDAPFRTNPPEAGPEVTFTPPKATEHKLANGLRVVYVPSHDVPIVAVRLVVLAGAADPGAPTGVYSFMGAMLEQGTDKKTALEVSDAFEAIGAQHGAGFDWDSGSLYAKVLKERAEKALELVAECALRPAFADAEIERYRSRRLAQLVQERSQPGAMAQNALAASVFGPAHPYGHPLAGAEADVKAIDRKKLQDAHKRAFVPGRLALVVAGDFDPAAMDKAVNALFGGLKPQPSTRAKVAKVAPLAKPEGRLVFVDRPQAPQSQVWLAQPGVMNDTKDRAPIVIMNEILGGMFSSRINLNLREKNAFTYGAHSSFAFRRGQGPFRAGGAIFADKTTAAIGELFAELNAIRERDVTDEELELAKKSYVLAMPARFETASDAAAAFGDLVAQEFPLDEYERRLERVSKVTKEDVRRVAKETLNPKTLKVVVVGDKAKLAPQLEALHLGAPEMRDAFGELESKEQKK